MVAKTVIDVILGEAGGRTQAERFADMVAIASVIQNRSTLAGQTPQSIVSVQREFNAYGKSLPKGVGSYRSLAEKAWNQVQTSGPVHNATYYATSKAKGNLPRGLSPVTKTTGHEFFTDPQNRSFRTSQGFVTPATETHAAMLSGNLVAPQNPYAGLVPAKQVQTVSLPETAPVAESRPTRGLGMAALAPRGLAPFQEAYGPNRPNPPQEAISNIARSAVEDVLGPGYTVKGISGQENPGRQYGSNRHSTGTALDFQIVDPSGRTLNATENRQAMADVAQAAAAKGATGIGLGTNYMGARGMHIDQVQPGPGQSNTWGNIGSDKRETLTEAMQYSLMPESYYARAMPEQMPTPDAWASMPGLVAKEEPVAAANSPARPDNQMAGGPKGMGGLGGTYVGGVPGQEAPKGLAAPIQEPVLSAPLQTAKVQMTPPVTATREIVDRPIADVPQAQPATPAAPSDPNFAGAGLGAIQGLFSAPAGTFANSASHPGFSFQSHGDGVVTRSDPRGNTIQVSASDFNAPTTGKQGNLGDMFGGAKHGDRAKAAAMGFGVGGLPGAAVGGLFGPQIMDKVNAFGRGLGQQVAGHSSQLGGLFGGLFGGGNSFPSAPPAPAGSLPGMGSNLSYSDMSAISPQAAAAISAGRGGLY